MSGRDVIEAEEARAADEESGSELLRLLKETGSAKAPQTAPQVGVVIGQLIGMTNEGRTPLVLYPGQPGTAALVARTLVDLHGPHIGRQIVLMFEAGDPAKPIVMGVLREGEGWPLDGLPGQVELEAGGERLVVTAKHGLFLRCGKASIELLHDGRVVIRGETILTQAVGSNRIRGGSVELN